MPLLRSLALSLAFGWAAAIPALSAESVLSPEPLQEDVYIIGPGDVLDLKLFDAAELSALWRC